MFRLCRPKGYENAMCSYTSFSIKSDCTRGINSQQNNFPPCQVRAHLSTYRDRPADIRLYLVSCWIWWRSAGASPDWMEGQGGRNGDRDGCQFRCLWQLSKRVMQVGVNIAWGEVWLDSSSTGGKRKEAKETERGERGKTEGEARRIWRGEKEEMSIRERILSSDEIQDDQYKCGSRHQIKYCYTYKLSFYGCMAMPDWECARWLVVEIVWWRNISM